MRETIFALSSGSPPAALAVVRISGPAAAATLLALAGRVPKSRRATLCTLRDRTGEMLDSALVLWLPGPDNAIGEDTAELHLHGGRALVAAVERELWAMAGLRRAEPGEFTRRAFANGRIDLAEAEGLADLLAAETELQRRSALAMASGELSRLAEAWRTTVLALGAAVEAVLDFADEDDVAEMPRSFADDCRALASDLAMWLSRPRAEPLREGFRVILVGPPNCGKSSLFNALCDNEVAITSPIAGTTRDVLTQAVALDGVPVTLIDTAGLRTDGEDEIEQIGIERAHRAIGNADLILWLGPEGAGPEAGRLWEVEAKSECPERLRKASPRHRVSALAGTGIGALRADIVATARQCLPQPGAIALGERQHRLIGECRSALLGAVEQSNPLLVAEHLREARLALDRLVGRSGTEDMLDALFGRFCIGK